MEIVLKRAEFTENSTISDVYVDGQFECYMLEDPVREVPGVPVEQWKIRGRTAIPYGRYRVERTWSPRFGRMLPILVGVQGYVGVRFHPGNTAKDTDGCPLPGRKKGKDVVTESRLAFEALDAKIVEALACGEQVWTTITKEDL